MIGKDIIPIGTFGETKEFHYSIVYWMAGTLFLVHLGPEGAVNAEQVPGITRYRALDIMRRQKEYPAEDPYDLVLLAQKLTAPA